MLTTLYKNMTELTTDLHYYLMVNNRPILTTELFLQTDLTYIKN